VAVVEKVSDSFRSNLPRQHSLERGMTALDPPARFRVENFQEGPRKRL
jgi:hypothetical protein